MQPASFSAVQASSRPVVYQRAQPGHGKERFHGLGVVQGKQLSLPAALLANLEETTVPVSVASWSKDKRQFT
jgi:hypothetical protein